jgi:hypothetical protein
MFCVDPRKPVFFYLKPLTLARNKMKPTAKINHHIRDFSYFNACHPTPAIPGRR